MPDIDISKHYLKIGNVKYFRGKAENVVLGSYGEKIDPLGANAYLSAEDRVRRSFLRDRVNRAGRHQVTWSRQRAADVEANGKLKVFGLDLEVAATMSFEEARSGNLELVKFVVDEGKLKTMLNKDATAARTFLASKKSARVVSEVYIVVTGELSQHIRTATSVTVAPDTPGDPPLAITLSGGSSGTHTVRLDPGTTFAYLLHKVTKWNDDRTVILDMEDDRKGMG